MVTARQKLVLKSAVRSEGSDVDVVFKNSMFLIIHHTTVTTPALFNKRNCIKIG